MKTSMYHEKDNLTNENVLRFNTESPIRSQIVPNKPKTLELINSLNTSNKETNIVNNNFSSFGLN